jgi:asparagine synthase (glutamine-hydrolysing)
MCGIAGMIGSAASIETAKAMADRLRHRGPDGEGSWSAPGVAFAHRRLAIIDLSPGGAQPMQLGNHVITYNGELYNYRELSQQLEQPLNSSSDTEVLLRLLARDDKRCLQQLAGMFAFGLWDGAQRRFLGVRDRLGIKPFYYRPLDNGLAFASELKALLVLAKPPIDPSAVRDFLFYGYIPAPKTIYQGIYKLPAGHWLEWQDGKIKIERYWHPSIRVRPRSVPESIAELDALLRHVVPEQTVADVPVGVFLSGGIDSALTASYLNRPHTYTLDFPGEPRSEAAAARAVAEKLGTQHTEMATLPADLDQALARLPQLFDEPFADSAAWSNYLIAQCARREVTVALSGEGGDEIFCGYPRYWSDVGARSSAGNRFLARRLPPLSRLGQSMQRRALTGPEGFSAALGALTAMQVDALLQPAWQERDYQYGWFYDQFWREGLTPLAQLRWLDLNTNLPEGLLVKVDRTSMAHSLEVRPPLLDHRLVEFMLSVDPQLLVNRKAQRGKELVRKLMAPKLPPGHLDRPKSGFGLPTHRWLKGRPELVTAACDRLLERGIFRRRVGPGFRRAWSVLMLDRWLTESG